MAKNYKQEEEQQKALLRAQRASFTGDRLGWPASDFCSVVTPLLRDTCRGVGKASLLWRITRRHPGPSTLLSSSSVPVHTSSQEASGQAAGPAEGKSPPESEPVLLLLLALGCLCFMLKGMGGIGLPSPF